MPHSSLSEVHTQDYSFYFLGTLPEKIEHIATITAKYNVEQLGPPPR